MKSTIEKVSVIGLGKLGLPTMTFFASRGCSVIGADHSKHLVVDLEKDIIHSEEPGLREMYFTYRKRISVTDSITKAINNSHITFVIVPTPSLPSGEFSTDYVKETAKAIGKSLRVKSKWHLAVLVSTVMPGATRRDFIGTIEKYSSKKCSVDFGVCYSPEFIALGNVLNNLANPDFMLIGESDPESGKCLQKFHEKILPKTVQKCRMSLENAELAKIAVNTFVTTKISYANMLANICENVPGLDVSVITSAIGLDARIGRRYLGTGLGYGGPCFPRDNKALAVFAEKVGAHANIAQATDSINVLQANRLVSRIRNLCSHFKNTKKKKVAVMGLSYKPDTDVIEESQSIQIVQKMARDRKSYSSVSVFDRPETLQSARKKLGNTVQYASSLEEATRDADVVVIAVSDRHFIPQFSSLKNGGNGVIIVDPWRLISESLLPFGSIYCTVGKRAA
jgi:UDPglucose 6-dehydrogenase